MHLMPVSKHEAIQNLLAITGTLIADDDRDGAEAAIELVYAMCGQLAPDWNDPDVPPPIVVGQIILDDPEYFLDVWREHYGPAAA